MYKTGIFHDLKLFFVSRNIMVILYMQYVCVTCVSMRCIRRTRALNSTDQQEESCLVGLRRNCNYIPKVLNLIKFRNAVACHKAFFTCQDKC